MNKPSKEAREEKLRQIIKEGRTSGASSPWNVSEFLANAHERANKIEGKK